ncbi:MAG: hypothetical protein GC151_12935 [Betaproteobacteria bacterium]|nr:hypothetical protein [Betaproteobacteria bacterium]
MEHWALVLWLALLLLAIPYTRRARHPSMRPLAAYLLFVTILSLCSAVLYFTFIWLLTAFDLGASLSGPAVATILFALVLIPAFLIARWQLRRPKRQPSAIPD